MTAPSLVSILAALALLVGSPPGAAAAAGGVWPLDPAPAVVGAFDPPAEEWGAGHRGVDLSGRVGQPVRSALPGMVTFAGRLAGRGVVVVDHGATRTTYEPVTAAVGLGDVVLAGDELGTLELFGSHCFPSACLHWGLLEGESYLDPLSLVGAGPVRLLPLAEAGPEVSPPQARGWAWRYAARSRSAVMWV